MMVAGGTIRVGRRLSRRSCRWRSTVRFFERGTRSTARRYDDDETNRACALVYEFEQGHKEEIQ